MRTTLEEGKEEEEDASSYCDCDGCTCDDDNNTDDDDDDDDDDDRYAGRPTTTKSPATANTVNGSQIDVKKSDPRNEEDVAEGEA